MGEENALLSASFESKNDSYCGAAKSMQINPLSIFPVNNSSLCTFVWASRVKQNHKKGGECGRLLGRWKREMTPLMAHKDFFMASPWTHEAKLFHPGWPAPREIQHVQK